MKFILTLTFVVPILFVQGQLKLRVADQYFNELAYSIAVELYQDLAEGKKSDEYTIRRTAECYRLINDTKNSEVWYEKLVALGNYSDDDVYYYAQNLKGNKKYIQANEWMAKLYAKQPNNSIAKEHNSNQSYFVDLIKDSSNFSLETLENINSEQSDFGPYLYDKETLLFASSRRNSSARNKQFNWDQSAFLDIYSSIIDDSKQTNKANQYLDNDLRSIYHEGPVSFSNKNTVMYVTRSNYFDKKIGKSSDNVNNLKLFVSIKDKEEWQPLQPFPFNSDEYSVGHASLSEDGKTMFFVSDRPGTIGQTDIWLSTFKENTWSDPINLGLTINTEGKEMFPYYHEPTGLLYFASQGHVGLGGLDIFVAFPDGNGGFSNVKNVGYPINTNSDDFGLVLTDITGNYGYFSSNRNGGKGKDDIYGINIYKSFISNLIIDFVVMDPTGKGVSSALVEVYDANGKQIAELKTDENGQLKYPLDRNQEYHFITTHQGFKNDSLLFNSKDIPSSVNEKKLTVNLKNQGQYVVEGSAIDKESGSDLTDYTVTLINNSTGDQKEVKVDSQSDSFFQFEAQANTEYTLIFEKDGYIADRINLFTEDGTNKNVIGNLSRTGIRIENIYYDYDKYYIRKDAKKSLNELAELLKQYPDMKIEMGSHTDSRNENKYNENLAKNRAKAAVEYLVKKGIDRNRLTWKGYGESQLLNKCIDEVECSEEDHQLNRRTEFKILN